MDYEIGWSDLLIEKGTLDPLSLWRVGDRMVNDLLSPFTTVVTNRPARYLSMYCWIIDFLNNQSITDRKMFWKRFYEIEAFLLCAVQLHKKHSYEPFVGQIGSETALKLINKAQEKKINLTKFEKISNGWETNYKGSMAHFNLTDVDYGIPSGLNLTTLGKKLAQAYMNSIKDTIFFQSYKSKSEVPLAVIEELAPYSCTCLLQSPHTDNLNKERVTCVTCLLKPGLVVPKHNIEGKDLWHSIFLFFDFLKVLQQNKKRFDLQTWRRALSTLLYYDEKKYLPSIVYKPVFMKWQIYNIDSLLVFALESGLSGFLELLHKKGGEIKKSELTTASFQLTFKEIKKEILDDTVQTFEDSVMSTLTVYEKLTPPEQLKLEAFLVDNVKSKNDVNKLIYSFLLFLYAQAVFNKLESNPDYKDALKFYKDRSQRDGYELSLFYTSSDIKKHKDKIEYLFNEYFLNELIISRQWSTRSARGKEQAWFGYINETKTYQWENDYKPTLYRAPRSIILMTFLLSLGIVSIKDGGWEPDLEFMHIMGL